MSEPLSRERLEGLKRGVEQGHIDSTVITRAELDSLLAAAARVAALEGLLRRAERDLFLLFGVDEREVSFLSANNIPMGMEKRKQKIVRDLLAALRAENGGEK